MRQKNQILMFSDAELSLIKNTFSGDGEDFLYLIRNVLLQFPITLEEKNTLKKVMNEEVYKVVKKKILPSIDPDAPFGQLADLWQTLHNDLKTRSVDDMEYLFKAKQLEINYLAQQFEYLQDVDKVQVATINLASLAEVTASRTPEDWYINNTARNFILSYVDSFLIQLKTIADKKDESVEDTKKRLTRDSSK